MSQPNSENAAPAQACATVGAANIITREKNSSSSGAKTRQQWSGLIHGAWQRSVNSIFETGQLLIKAKAELDHGQFTAMVERDLPFTAGTAQRLMCIARHPTLANPAHAPHLPPSWMTLYELTKLPDSTLQAGFIDGAISPKLERKDIRALAGHNTSKPSRKPLAAAWTAASIEERRALLDGLGREGICALMSPGLITDLEQHVIALQVSHASAAESLAVNLTRLLRHALAHTTESGAFAALAGINRKLKGSGRTADDVVVAIGPRRGKRRHVS